MDFQASFAVTRPMIILYELEHKSGGAVEYRVPFSVEQFGHFEYFRGQSIAANFFPLLKSSFGSSLWP